MSTILELQKIKRASIWSFGKIHVAVLKTINPRGAQAATESP